MAKKILNNLLKSAHTESEDMRIETSTKQYAGHIVWLSLLPISRNLIGLIFPVRNRKGSVDSTNHSFRN